MKTYEQLALKIIYLIEYDVLTTSGEITQPGDGWVSDPFVDA